MNTIFLYVLSYIWNHAIVIRIMLYTSWIYVNDCSNFFRRIEDQKSLRETCGDSDKLWGHLWGFAIICGEFGGVIGFIVY